MKTFITGILTFSLMLTIGCNRKASVQEGQLAFTEMQYIVTLSDGYTMKDLRAALGSKVDKIGPSSKSKNVFLLTLNEAMDSKEILEHPFILDVVNPSQEVEAPTTIKQVKKGTSSPIKQKGNNE